MDAETVPLDGWRAFWAKWHEDNFRAPDPRREPELWQLSRLVGFGYAPPADVRFMAENNGQERWIDALNPYFNALAGHDGGFSAGIRSFDALRSFSMLSLYATRDAELPHLALAAAVVEAKSPGLTEEQGDRARRTLGQELADHCRALAAFIGWDWPGLPKLPKPVNGFLDIVDIGALDIGASLDGVAGFLEGIGPEGKKAASAARKVDPVALWVNPAGPKTAPDGPTRSPLMWALAVVLWADVVGPALEREATAEREAAAERERARASRPVVARAFAVDELLPAMGYGSQRALPGILPDSHELKDRKGRIVARIVGDVETTLRGLEKIGSPVGQRLINSIVYRAWEQYEANSQDAGVVEYEGGWAGLARALGHDEKDTATLRALAVAGQSVRWDSGLAYGGGWWTWSATRGGPGNPGVVRFRPADPLRPAYITALEQADRAHTPSSRERRRPIPLLAYGPPVGSLNERSHGAVWLLSRWFVVELVDRAAELHLDGGIHLDERQWRDLADKAGLSLANLSRLRDAWLMGDDPSKAPPLIKNVDGGRVTLSDAHELSRIFIEERGMLVAEGRKSGRRSAEAKRNMAQKKAPRPRGKA